MRRACAKCLYSEFRQSLCENWGNFLVIDVSYLDTVAYTNWLTGGYDFSEGHK